MMIYLFCSTNILFKRVQNEKRNNQSKKNFQRIMGIEPISSAWKAENLPLIHIRFYAQKTLYDHVNNYRFK